MSLDADLEAKLAQILVSPRGDLMYTDYTPSKEHKRYMEALPEKLKIPRSQWMTHKNRYNMMMPQYHVHFRQELQDIVCELNDSYTNPSARSVMHLRKVVHFFAGSNRGLQGHVTIEEQHIFPKFQEAHKSIDMGVLYAAHAGTISRIKKTSKRVLL